MNYLLDTNIILLYTKGSKFSQRFEDKYQLFSGAHQLATSIVCLGEIDAIIKKSGIGSKRQERIMDLLKPINVAGIAFDEVINAYGDIDAYSQGKLPNPSPFTARNMGKNDIWIAATAHVYELTLLTADQDFAHLADAYIDLQQVTLSNL